MIALVKLIVTISFSYLANSSSIAAPLAENKIRNSEYVSIAIAESSKERAFQILENKCNVYHGRRNKRRVFTTTNMDSWAEDVYKQVFVKKRMRKGKNIKLTLNEYQDLLTWISSSKTNNYGNQN
ncbi:hypothetical protein L0P88_18420 [Muricauda sp. SCSIO 64092]|uniref:hypothetical protein n=1 Tax=Allomuricauda sp. SCSIO 64092 TaxID=2908842 RepID=UPI001FF68C0A|nr:hypothetical protein [Muricauda sp. SCSIO 64092]UOY05902.1 hypothetical protein L0P88_18420 [Muricauda sp. SCSIO 64092]